MGIEKNGDALSGRSGPRRGCSTIRGSMERTMSEKLRDMWKEAVVA
jgi:hypothetical protein